MQYNTVTITVPTKERLNELHRKILKQLKNHKDYVNNKINIKITYDEDNGPRNVLYLSTTDEDTKLPQIKYY